MADDNGKVELRLALQEEIKESLSFAFRFAGRRRVHDADEMMAWIRAGHLVEHVRISGYVIMKKPPTRPVSIALHPRKPE